MAKIEKYILLVDDEQNILNALRRELEDWAEERGLGFLTALSARKGLEILAERPGAVPLVVSDLRMPEMKGSDFLLEAKRRFPDIVAILLTGFSEAEEIVKAVQAGIFSFMLKPWESAYLLAELTKAYDYAELRRKEAEYAKRVAEELRWAGEMQRALLKPNLPRSDGLEFRASYRPVAGLYCGGDYYDVIFLGSDRYLLLIGDVAGHGVKAAFVTGILKAVIYSEYVRDRIGRDFSPGAFLSWLNERMGFEFRNASDMLITFFAGVIDRRNSLLIYANAGHNHPFLVRSGKATELPVSGSALGFAQTSNYPEQRLPLLPGDLLNLYTDGLVEKGGREAADPLKLGPLLEGLDYGSDYHRRILEAGLGAMGIGDFADDVTLLTALLR